MALARTSTALMDTVVLVNSNADTVSNALSIANSYSTTVFLELANGATGPTVPAYIGIQLAVDEDNDSNISSNGHWYNYGGGLTAGTGVNGLQSWVVEVPSSATWIRVYAGGNTGNGANVNAEAWVTVTTSM